MTFRERLENSFKQMMGYRTAVGYTTATYKSSVPPFISFCAEKYPTGTVITRGMLDEWLAYYPYSINSRAAFISLVREFTKYLHFLGYDDYIPDDDYKIKRTVYNPFLFTDEELRILFHAFDTYQGHTCGKRYLPEMVLPVYSRLLYCCGMRPQEPPALRKQDVNLSTGDVYIRQSKKHKDRHIILSDDMLDLCKRYDCLAGNREWFFQRWDGKPYDRRWYTQLFVRLCNQNGLSQRGNPRPYDLRHAFASRNIIRWMENGRDVMELLPYLSAYMGHAELSSTLYYIHLLPEKLRQSSKIDWEKFQAIYGKEVPEIED